MTRPTSHPQGQMTSAEIERIILLYAAGHSIRTIANLTGRSYGGIWYHLNYRKLLRPSNAQKGKSRA